MPAQTLRQAKASYKANGPRLSPREIRALERGAELDRRATEIREREKRKKTAQQKRLEREEKERQKRNSLGIGLATQTCGWSLSQKAMKRGMEAFVGMKKVQKEKKLDTDGEEKENQEAGKVDNVTPVQNTEVKDPWDEEDVDEDSLLSIAEPEEAKPRQASQPSIPKPAVPCKSTAAVPAGQMPPPPLPPKQDNNATISMGPPPLKRDSAGNMVPASRWPSDPVRSNMPVPPNSLRPSGAAIDRPKPPTSVARCGKGISSFINASVYRTVPKLDEWDDFLDSSTQIARDIHLFEAPAKPVTTPIIDFPISTQDLDISLDDLTEIGIELPTERLPPDKEHSKSSDLRASEASFKATTPFNVSLNPTNGTCFDEKNRDWQKLDLQTCKLPQPPQPEPPPPADPHNTPSQNEGRSRRPDGKWDNVPGWGTLSAAEKEEADKIHISPPELLVRIDRVARKPQIGAMAKMIKATPMSMVDLGLSTQDIRSFDDDLQFSP